jgi:hypothetical protein
MERNHRGNFNMSSSYQASGDRLGKHHKAFPSKMKLTFFGVRLRYYVPSIGRPRKSDCFSELVFTSRNSEEFRKKYCT